jgi:hypothetical protein
MPDTHAHVMPAHGARELPGLAVDDYNAELRDAEGFVGDRASSRAFRSILEDWRDRIRQVGADPLGDKPSEKVQRKKLDKLLLQGDVEAAGLVLSGVEEFAQELATVCRRLLRLKTWRDTDTVVIGGGFRASRIGELAIGRAGVLLKADGRDIRLLPIRHDPDEAGLLGAAHLVPQWMLSGHDAILAVDIGGSTIRAGILALEWRKRALADARVAVAKHWRHKEVKPGRDAAVKQLVAMLNGLIRAATKQRLRLAPFIGVGCPGLIRADGAIERGGQNLPGHWEDPSFNLAGALHAKVADIAGQQPYVLMHNDAVMQGLSELPWMRDVPHWGVLTIGTGLGNAHFTTKSSGGSA